MRAAFRLSLLALLLVCFLPAIGQDNKTDKKPDKKTDKKADPAEKKQPEDKLVPLGELIGRLVRIEGAQKYLTLAVPQPRYTYPYRITYINRDVDLQATDEMKVRTLNPPVEFDEKGKPRKYTAKELKEMRGPDRKLPGYTADFESLKIGQIVRVTVARRKSVLKAMQHPQRVNTKDKDKENDAPLGDRPEVTMIVILAEPTTK
jgi:hypothetical protein